MFKKVLAIILVTVLFSTSIALAAPIPSVMLTEKVSAGVPTPYQTDKFFGFYLGWLEISFQKAYDVYYMEGDFTITSTHVADNWESDNGLTPLDKISIAVDPDVIPLGTYVWIEGLGFRLAEYTCSRATGNVIEVFTNQHYPIYGENIKVWTLQEHNN